MAVAVVVLAGLTPVSAAEAAVAHVEACDEHLLNVRVDPHVARAEVPPRFRVLEDVDGKALVTVRGARCASMRVGTGADAPGRMGQVSVAIVSPDGTGHAGGVPCCTWYALEWVTDHREFAQWLRQDGGLGERARFVSGLEHTWDKTLGRFAFEAPNPAPSPFEMRGRALSPAPPDLSMEGSYWVERQGGATKIWFAHDTLRISAAEGTVEPSPGSRLASMIGDRAVVPVADGVSGFVGESDYRTSSVACRDTCYPDAQ